jgi:hypothetical protein
LTEQSVPFWRGQDDATELRTRNARYTVMTRKRLVEIRVVGIPERDGITIVAQLAPDEEVSLRRHGLAQADGVVGKIFRIRLGLIELIEAQPREEKARHEGVGAWIREHALHLLLERLGLRQSGGLFHSNVARRSAMSSSVASVGGGVLAPSAVSIDRSSLP